MNAGIVQQVLGVEVETSGSVGGGSISAAWWCRLRNGREIFFKRAPSTAPAGLIEQEVIGLQRMRETGTVRVPEVIASGSDWLILEWLEPGVESRSGWKVLGAELARMHRVTADAYGWEADNFIGPLHQPNQRTTSWPEFWRDQRLRPQWELAASRLDAGTSDLLERLMDEIEVHLEGVGGDGASLLHGDLWSGNVQFTPEGAALVDPSCSYGHREVDLAMAALFGGFGSEFFAAYEAEWPLLPGAGERRLVYQLYYLLVHVNLFGGGYIDRTRSVLRRLL